MKRMACLLLALSLLVLTGCGKDRTEDVKYMGYLEGNIYTDAHAGFGCYLGDGWEAEGRGQEDALEETPVQIVMKAENKEALSFISIQYIQVDSGNQMMLANLSEEEVLDQLIARAKDTGRINEEDTLEKVQVDFLGQKRWAVRRVFQESGVPCYQTTVYTFAAGDYGVSVNCISLLEDKTQELMNLFIPIADEQ